MGFFKFMTLCLLACQVSSSGACPNRCSGHGSCEFAGEDGATCNCVEQYNTTQGPDCSKRACPKGVAWWDFATAVDTAHADSECSNMGSCDRSTGVCACKTGFEGAACEKLSCPATISGVCNGKGRCMTMRQAALEKDDVTLFYSSTYSLWDADKIQGCVCDEGYTGYDCSERQCTAGHTSLVNSPVQEKQILECTCETTCSGSFFVQFRDEVVELFPHESESETKARLEAAESIRTVDINFNGGTALCDGDGVSTEITFRGLPGNLPGMRIYYSDSLASTGSAPTLAIRSGGTAGDNGGTTVDGSGNTVAECSGRGYCHRSLGQCFCTSTFDFKGGTFEPSDGEGNAGSYDDCGYGSTTPTACAFGDNGVGVDTECSGHGTCSVDGLYECSCVSGYTGNACQYLECPSGVAWFDEASADNTAHAQAPCSNMGLCDRTTGTCTCRSGFTGLACEKLECPKDANSATCSGHGTCYDMKSLALLSEDELGDLRGVTYGLASAPGTWDFESVQGCYCDAGYFHGPFAYDFSDYRGSYDCSLLTCPLGDNPATIGQTNEVQTMTCVATGGVFTVTFRQTTSQDIQYDADLATFQAALENMETINDIEVGFSGANTVCSSGGGTTTTLSYKVPGDLPLPTFGTGQLTGSAISVVETTKGTTEAIECSGQGICDRTTGTCKCFQGFESSDGSGDGATVGQRGDCGALSPFPNIQALLAEE